MSGKTFDLDQNSLTSLNFHCLEKIAAPLRITNNPSIEYVSPPRVTEVGELDVASNYRLLNFTANLLEKPDRIKLSGSFTNVEFYSLREVKDFIIEGHPSMDCSWFDENLKGNVVKGEYKCEGNHTKPDEPRKPSTPTNLPDLEALLGGSGFGGDRMENSVQDEEDKNKGEDGTETDETDQKDGEGRKVEEDRKGVSKTEKVGIVIAVAVAVLWLLAIPVLLLEWWRKRHRWEEHLGTVVGRKKPKPTKPSEAEEATEKPEPHEIFELPG